MMSQKWTKIVRNKKYEIRYNCDTGREETEGVNGNPDPTVLDYPSLIDIGIMGSCYNKCKLCYQGHKKEPHMTYENFEKIIKESANYTNQVALGGRGDPNKHPEFSKILKYCRDHNIVPNYTTSGIDITRNELDATKMYCGAAAVSMMEQDHTWDALDLFVDAGVKTNIHMILSRESISDAVELAKGNDPWNSEVNLNKINAIIFLLFKPFGAGEDHKDLVLRERTITRFLDIIYMSQSLDKKFKFKLGIDACLSSYIFKHKIPFKATQMQSINTCEGGRFGCYIGPDMKMMPCSFGDRNQYGVDLTNSTIKDAWNSDIFINFRKTLEKDPFTCPFKK